MHARGCFVGVDVAEAALEEHQAKQRDEQAQQALDDELTLERCEIIVN